CASPASRSRRPTASCTAPPACRRSPFTLVDESGTAPARRRGPPAHAARSGLAHRLADGGDRAARAARAVVADAAHAVPLRLALLFDDQPHAAAVALAGDRGRR